MAFTSTRNFNAEPERNLASFEGTTTNLDMMRRAELWKLAESMKIQYPSGATKDEMIQIIRGHQHVINALDEAVDVMKHSGDKNSPLVEQVMEVMKKAAPKEGIPEENQDDTILMHAPMYTLRKKCKERGISTKNTDTADALRAKLGVKRHEPNTDDNKPEQSRPETSGSDTF